jgi:GNAT superfamily N-acetyltransferase
MDDAGLTIRRARADELAACADLYVKVLRETFTWLSPERHRAEKFLEDAAQEEVYVALEGGRLVGLAAFYRPQNFIHSLYVTERGRGVGKALLDHLETTSRGPLALKCQAKNLRAQAFYLREGFRVVERGVTDDIAWVRLVRPKRWPKLNLAILG